MGGWGFRQGWGLSSGRGLCLVPTGSEKALGEVEVGLRLNTAGVAQVCLWPWRLEDLVQDPSWLTGPEWVGETLGVFPPSL